jgi:hypothetical protein
MRYVPIAQLTPEQHAARRAKMNAYNRSRPRSSGRAQRAYFPPGTPEAVKRERARQVRKEWRQSRIEISRAASNNSKLRQKFGLSIQQYEAQLAKQGGVCAICGRTPSPNRRLAVDHCHDTGSLRGLLCSNCNTALGQLDDAPARLAKAIAYLQSGGIWGRA